MALYFTLWALLFVFLGLDVQSTSGNLISSCIITYDLTFGRGNRQPTAAPLLTIRWKWICHCALHTPVVVRHRWA
jgi:hypothetical protein